MVRLEPIKGGRGLRCFEPVDNLTTRLYGSERLDPITPARESFPLSMTRTATVTTRQLRIDSVPAVTVRDLSGVHREPSEETETEVWDHGTHIVELSTPLKVYLRVESSVSVRRTADETLIDFDRSTPVHLGFRVHRPDPLCTVTTSLAVDDVFTAISTFGAAIDQWIPARSYPTLRGHPPRLAIGEQLQIPAEARPPATGIRLELPPALSHAAAAAPLAYYLGATLVPGDEARLLVDGRPVRTFDSGGSLGRQCGDLLRRVLFLDCVARRRWSYPIDLLEREVLVGDLHPAWDALPDRSPGARLEAYLEIPPERYRKFIPDWERQATVVPTQRGLRSLPYLAFDLVDVDARSIDAGPASTAKAVTDGGSSRGSQQTDHVSTQPRIDQLSSVGGPSPIGLDPAFPAAFEHRLTRKRDRNHIRIAIVCSDDAMNEELEFAWAVYDRIGDDSVQIVRYEGVTGAKLRTILAQSWDYLHFIGHVDERGFKCRDVHVDVSSLESVGVEIAFLNACASREQAIHMVQAGMASGIATDVQVVNSVATRVGSRLAQLLIHGFPLGAALALARPRSEIDRQYSVIGDPSMVVRRNEPGLPYFCQIRECGTGRYELTLQNFLTHRQRQGAVCRFRIDATSPYQLAPTRHRDTLGHDDILRFLSYQTVPVLVDDDLRWSDEPLGRIVSRTRDRG